MRALRVAPFSVITSVPQEEVFFLYRLSRVIPVKSGLWRIDFGRRLGLGSIGNFCSVGASLMHNFIYISPAAPQLDAAAGEVFTHSIRSVLYPSLESWRRIRVDFFFCPSRVY